VLSDSGSMAARTPKPPALLFGYFPGKPDFGVLFRKPVFLNLGQGFNHASLGEEFCAFEAATPQFRIALPVAK